jgi:glycosyltransferase involved in cell wall biosynthesis
MVSFRMRGGGTPVPPVFDAAPLDIHGPSVASIAGGHRLKAAATARASAAAHRVRDVYLNDPQLQQIYPLGLLPLGQRDFLEWLTSHGRADQQLTDREILEFLEDSVAHELRGLCLTYLLQPAWQQFFPDALTRQGWAAFREWIQSNYGEHLRTPLAETLPSTIDEWMFKPSRTPLAGVNLLSHFCNPSGLQQAALWTKAALERAGLRTSCRDIPVPRRVIPANREQWLGLEIFPVTILNQAATPYFVSGYDRSGLFPRESTHRIAYWNWELEKVPDEWAEAAELVDEIWSPTRFVADSMRNRMPKPVHHILPGVEIGPVETINRGALGIPEDHFLFLFMFDLHSQVHRKNPVGVFRAFQKAFRHDDRVTLLIKTSGGDIHSADFAALRETIRGSNVILLDQVVSRAQAYGFIAMTDGFVSLHRSEGFGLGLAEAMLLGKPVIATGYSGNLDFMSRENTLLVDYEMVEIKEDRPIYTRGNFWAEPSIEQAAAYMRQVFENPDAARARALRVQPQIQRLLSLEAAGARMRKRLEEIDAR